MNPNTPARMPFSVRLRARVSRGLWDHGRWMLPRRHVRCRGRGGWIYLNPSESRMMLERALGVYEYTEMAAAARVIRPGMTAVDVGANKGDYALMFARLVGPSGRVLAFEPDDRNLGWVRRSVRANGYRNVETFPYALADADGEALFNPGRASGWGSLVASRSGVDAEHAVPVQTRRLDSVAAELGIPSIDVLKVDVEGAELGVLRGARALLSAPGARTLLVAMDSDVESDRAEVQRLLAEFGYAIAATRGPTGDAAAVVRGGMILATRAA